LATKTIKLKYITVERFLKDYAQLRKGGLTLPVKSPFPLNTHVSVTASVPDIEPLLTLKGIVKKTFDPPGAARPQKTGVICIGFNGGSQEALKIFDNILCCHEKYRELLDLAAPAGSGETVSPENAAAPAAAAHSSQGGALSMDWLRTALAPGKAPVEKEAAAQYRADTAKMVQDVRGKIRSYVDRILQVKTTEEAVVLLKLFRRILPDLIQQAAWPIVLYLTRAVDQAAKTTVFFAAASGLPANPLEFAFKNRGDDIVKAYATADARQRKMINDIAGRLDALGIEIMARALSACPDRRVRQAVMSALVKKGDLARNWILAVLDAPDQKWYLMRTALVLLRYVGKKEEEIDRARKLVAHDHPRVREEALNVLIALQAVGAEELIIAALNDADDNVRRRAMSCLTRLSPISESVIKLLLAKISAAVQPEKKAAVRHYRKIGRLIKALGAARGIAHHAEAENIILTLVRKLSRHNQGLFRRLKKSIGPDQSDVLAAAITALGKIGTDKSESFLEKLAGSKSPQAEPAQAAANHIKLRYIALLSNAPAEAGIPAIALARGLRATTEILAAGSQG
jgi:HEAT repeat protein